MQVKRSKIIALSAAFFWACFFIFRYGYHFNMGDQEEHLPQIYKLLNPALYPEDYFVSAPENEFTLRFLYIKLLYYLQFIVPLNPLIYSLLLLSLSTMAYFTQKIARLAGIPFFTALLAPGIILFITYFATVGGVRLNYQIFISSVIGKSIGIVGMYLMLSKNYYKAALVLGITALFHVMNGCQIMLISTLGMLWQEKGSNFKQLFLSGFIFLAIASIMIFPMFAKQFETHIETSLYSYQEIMYEVRNPHHFFWKHFPLADRIAFILLNLASIATIILTKQKDVFVKILWVIFGLLAINIIFFDAMHLWFLGNFQLYKLSIYAALFSTIVLMRASKYLNKPISYRFEKTLVLALPIASFLLLMLILNGNLLPERLSTRYKIGNYKKTALTEMHLWIEANIPIDALFLNDPTDNSFACEAKRSQAIAYTAIVHKPTFMYRWLEKVEKYYGCDIDDLRNGKPKEVMHQHFYLKLNQAQIEEDVDYLLVDKNELKLLAQDKFTKIHEVENWVLLSAKKN